MKSNFEKIAKSKLFQSQYRLILIFISINILVGLFTVVDYGVSTDEPLSWNFARSAVRYYFGLGEVVHVDYSHGGGFLIPAKLGQLLLSLIFPNWTEPYAWHMVYFIFFQISVFFIYLLAKKFTGHWGAAFAAILYGTQPLLWGHAFINPKDTPFMVLFLGTIVFSIYLADQIHTEDRNFKNFISQAKTEQAKDKKNNLVSKRLIYLIVPLGLYLFTTLGELSIHKWIESGILMLHNAAPASLSGKIFSLLAANSQELGAALYINKTILIYDGIQTRLNFFLILFTVLAAINWLTPTFYKFIFKSLGEIIKIKYFLPAAILFGMCFSARTMGIIALPIIGLYWLIKNDLKSWHIFLGLVIFTLMIGLIFWPDLWKAPIRTYLDYLHNVVSFERWNGKILFEGEIYNKTNYPRHLLPKLIGLQITEPALILAGVGIVLAAVKVWRKTYNWALTGLLAGWLFAPIILAVIFLPVIYNSFRHFIFILPPIFIFAGIALDAVFSKLHNKAWRVLLIAALLLPGILGIIQLHPYQYVYYNAFAGGVSGAFREYELDYWLTSYKEAIEYLNEYAPPNATIAVTYGETLVPWFTDPDLKIRPRIQTLNPYNIDYVIISTSWDWDTDLLNYFPNLVEIKTIEVQNVPLTKIYAFDSSD